MTTLGPMLLFRLRTIRKTVDGKFYPTRLVAQTLPLLTTICSGRCRTPSLEYGSHQNRVSKIGFIHSSPYNELPATQNVGPKNNPDTVKKPGDIFMMLLSTENIELMVQKFRGDSYQEFISNFEK